MEASLANFRPSNDSRLGESTAGQIQLLEQSPSGVTGLGQVPKSRPFRSDLSEDSPWNGKPYPEIEFFSSISNYSNQGTVGTLQDICSSVDYSYFLGQSIASPHATALLPSSGNFIARGGPSIVTPPSGGDSTHLPTYEQKHSITHASLNGDLAGSGLLPRNNLKAQSSPSCKLARVNNITKMKKDSYRVSQLIKAFPLIGKLKNILKAYPSCAMAISLLEESIGKTMAQESRASRSSLSTRIRPLNIESSNYSLVDSSACSNSTSISTAFDYSWPSQDDSSMTFPSSSSIPDIGFINMTMDNETPRVRTSNTTIYHCTVPVEGILCKFSANSEGDWVRHEESDKHWPQKRYMCINCIGLVKDEEGNSLCAFCLQRLPLVGSNKTHYLQCQKAQRGKHVFNAARKDHFRNHLKKHGIADITSEASTWIFAVKSDWHRQCGFCTQTFTNWDERKHHVAKHFQQGMDISSWIFPSPKRKRSDDYRPGINYRHDGHDDDDDNDDSHNNHQKGRRTSTAWFSGQPFSRQADNSYPAEGWLEWIDGSICDANTGPTSTEKVEAYLKYQSQVESEADDRSLRDTKSRYSRDYGTRVDVLRDIHSWVDGQDSQCIFWLSGLAGTGKSTIARRALEQRNLGASFFFSQGCGDALETFWKREENLPDPSRDILYFTTDLTHTGVKVGSVVLTWINDILDEEHKNRQRASNLINNLLALVKDRLQVVDLDLQDDQRQTPLRKAAYSGHKAVVKLLLEKRLDAKAADGYGSTPLYEVSKDGHVEIGKLLLDKGAEPGKRNTYSFTLLSWVPRHCHETVVKQLLEKSAWLKLRDMDGRAPLSWDAGYGHEVVVKLMLETGKLMVDPKDEGGQAPLSFAAEYGHEAVVRLLDTIVKILLDKGADVNSQDKDNKTPLSWAASKGHATIVKILLGKEADINSRDNGGQTPLSWAAGNGHAIIVKLLLDKGADINSRDKGGQTPLSWAAGNGHATIVKLLLDNEADVNSRDKDGQTPLSWAASKGHATVVQVLLAQNADPNSIDTKYGQTALSHAAFRGHVKIVNNLLYSGANANLKDNRGRTPLRLAEGNRQTVVASILRAHRGF